ncbi:MAG: helix-turn-helix transcriptional regulator [Actinomycetota bacterium]|nr:helix-turn-helix transcriptional regulator [Actinomycetota bacterium]
MAEPDKTLSGRELEVLKAVGRGTTSAEIAGTLNIAEATVKRHLANAYGKLGVGSRLGAVSRAVAEGLLDPWDTCSCPRKPGPTGAWRGRGTAAKTSSAAARSSWCGPPRRRPPGGPRVPRARDGAGRVAGLTGRPDLAEAPL